MGEMRTVRFAGTPTTQSPDPPTTTAECGVPTPTVALDLPTTGAATRWIASVVCTVAERVLETDPAALFTSIWIWDLFPGFAVQGTMGSSAIRAIDGVSNVWQSHILGLID
ncbi:unnamed protein product [Parascedosporium putredinis]|uniref:Uncharacterized protein n=1 Tax=Parascedosporium putredinis TaxID=1442378 RepID=A0A9P1H1X2_9PEZI|nr:unnamed protein product [Parascedosporium putredinis]CAI7994067.1 unnamed protein product [Parascedosporium putredinis]